MSTIIVVDDDLTNVTLIQMLLEMDGFQVVACTDTEQALKAAIKGVNAFLVDCNLAGGKSGLDLLRTVRAGKTSVPANTIFFVTSGDHRREAEAQEAGADLFLLKPYSPTELSVEFNRLFSLRGLNG